MPTQPQPSRSEPPCDLIAGIDHVRRIDALFVNAPLRDYTQRSRVNDFTLPVLGMGYLATYAARGDGAGARPSSGARRARRSRLAKPWGSSRKTSRVWSSAWTRRSVKRSPGTRVPVWMMRGSIDGGEGFRGVEGALLAFSQAFGGKLHRKSPSGSSSQTRW